MSVTIELEYAQVEKIVDQLDMQSKEQLFRHLGSLTFKDRLGKFTDKMSGIPLSMEEITEEVEKVRSGRYDAHRS